MKKQKGFTLIELMVVMAIIAILATAGLSAYTGYIKKARDTTRIADVAAINTIILGSMSTTGIPPQSSLAVYNLVKDMNNGQPLVDPLVTLTGTVVTAGKSLCYGDGPGGVMLRACSYLYRLCDGGMGYAVGARFESLSNTGLYATTGIPAWLWSGIFAATGYELGSCKTSCAEGTPGCTSETSSSSWLGPVKLTGGTPQDSWTTTY